MARPWISTIARAVSRSAWVSGVYFFFFQAEDGIRDVAVTGVQTCALPISPSRRRIRRRAYERRRVWQMVEVTPAVPLVRGVLRRHGGEWVRCDYRQSTLPGGTRGSVRPEGPRFACEWRYPRHVHRAELKTSAQARLHEHDFSAFAAFNATDEGS